MKTFPTFGMLISTIHQGHQLHLPYKDLETIPTIDKLGLPHYHTRVNWPSLKRPGARISTWHIPYSNRRANQDQSSVWRPSFSRSPCRLSLYWRSRSHCSRWRRRRHCPWPRRISCQQSSLHLTVVPMKCSSISRTMLPVVTSTLVSYNNSMLIVSSLTL